MKNYNWVGAIVTCLLTLSVSAYEATWSDAQKQIWDIVEQSWVDDVAENGKWPAVCVHDSYVSWGDSSTAPRYKDAVAAWSRFSDDSIKSVMHEVIPAALVVAMDTSVVHYHATTVTEDDKGERKQSVSPISETLVRDGSKWNWIKSINYATMVTEDDKGERKQSVSPISETLVRDGSKWNWIKSINYATMVTEDDKGERKQSVSPISETLVRDGSKWNWIKSINYEPKPNN
jgi:hypothetical protein